MFTSVQLGLKKSFDGRLVDELLMAYDEAKRNFYLGGLRLSAVEGGRFCEAAFRMLEQATTAGFTPLNVPINSEGIIKALQQSPKSYPESIRIHIPRALRVVYDIRNKRDAAHLADGIDPNVQDATVVIGVLDWVLAEFVRLRHGITADEAQAVIADLVSRRAPAVQDFDGFPKVLKRGLEASPFCLLLLYERGPKGATLEQLLGWVKPTMKKNLKRTLDGLELKHAYIHLSGLLYKITISGMMEVESKKLHEV